MIRKLITTTLLLSLPLTLGACGGCGKDNNQTTNNNQTTPDMGECVAGAAGCACTMDGTCDGDAMCVNNLCEGAQSSGLTITSDAARSCEIMLTESEGGRVLGATYAEGVKGSWRRRAPNVALALTRTDDAAFPASSASIQFAEGGTLPTVGKVRCFDAEGAEIDGASATLQ